MSQQNNSVTDKGDFGDSGWYLWTIEILYAELRKL